MNPEITPAIKNDFQIFLDSSMDLNNLFESANVDYCFRTHYVNTQTGVFGIEELLVQILINHGATFPKDSQNTEMRNIVIHGSMYFHQIDSAVRDVFNFERYPAITLRAYLAGRILNIQQVQLSNLEDKSRVCCKPRTKYYIAQ